MFSQAAPIARLLLRAEALSSSRIEGLSTPARKLLEREELDALGVDGRADSTEEQVISNVDALIWFLAETQGGPVSLGLICDVNARLLQHSAMKAAGGILRTSQNWVGTSHSTPVTAAYVPSYRRSSQAGASRVMPSCPFRSLWRPTGIDSSLRPTQMALRSLADTGIVKMASRNRKSGIYVCDAVLEELTVFERSLRTPEGDTNAARPPKGAPQRYSP